MPPTESDSQDSLPPEAPKPTWVEYCAEGDCEEFIIGSRAGLERLKEHIAIAIETGESLMTNDAGIEFNGVRRIDTDKKGSPESWGSAAFGWGCLVLIASILILAIIGARSLFGH